MNSNSLEKQPDVAEMNSMTAANAALKYLGKGVDISKYDTFADTERAILHTLLDPEVPDLYKVHREVSDRRIERNVHDCYTDYQDRMVKLQTMVFNKIVEIEFEANWTDTFTWDQQFNYKVEEVQTHTVEFSPDVVNRIPLLLEEAANPLSNSDMPCSKITDLIIRTYAEPMAEANVLHQKLLALAKQSEDVTEDMKLKVCENLLKSVQVSGATHFVSGVHLGAKVIRMSTTGETKTGKEKAINGNVAAEGIGIGVTVGCQQRSKYKEACECSMMLKGSGVDLNDDGSLPLTIPNDQEVVIGLDLLPITDLVPWEWKLPLHRVCIERLNKEQMKKPATPGKDENVPYLLKAGNFWLKADLPRIVATENLEEASHFYVIKHSKKPSSFYIEYRTSYNNLCYVSADSKHNDDVKLQIGKEHDKCLFNVHFVHDQQKAKLSDWSTKPLLIRRAKLSRFKRNKYYLSVGTSPKSNELRVTCSGDPSSNQMETQFSIINAPSCTLSMEKE